jgi:hypothetical protein
MIQIQPMLTADSVPGTVDTPIPMHVWDALAAEQQERVIRLMAHLACALATAPLAPPHQEAHHVDPPRHG